MNRLTNTLASGIAALTLALAGTAAHATTLAHWTFDDGPIGATAAGAGSILDSSGNGHHGTPFGNPTYAATPGGGTGLLFDGFGDRVFVADSTDFLVNSLTVEAIVRIDSLPGGGLLDQIVFRGDSLAGRDPFYLGILGDKLRFYIEDDVLGATALHSPDPLPTGTFLHVAGTLDDATGDMRLFINGTQVAFQNTPRRPDVAISGANGAGLGIGNLQDSGSQYLTGLIGEARISSRALAPSEFLGATSVPEPGTLALLGATLAGLGWSRRRVARRGC